MDSDNKKFGRGPRELTGAFDLIRHYKLLPHQDFFCKRSLPVSISDTHYLHNVIGDTEIRKGDGMQLGQLNQNNITSLSRKTNSGLQPFNLDILKEAFQLKEGASVDLPPSEKGTPTITGKSKDDSKDNKKKHKKHKDKDKEKDKEHKKKHKHRHKDKDKEKKKSKSGQHDKKRKHDGDENTNDIHIHKKNKHKSTKIDEH